MYQDLQDAQRRLADLQQLSPSKKPVHQPAPELQVPHPLAQFV